MATKIPLFIILFSALCFGQSKPTEVPAPTAHWFNTKPEIKDDADMQYMLDNAETVLSVIHDADMEYCKNGPTDAESYPRVKRCDGAI